MANAVDLTREVINELAFTPEELKELEWARTMPVTFDEDCLETTPERAMKFPIVSAARLPKKPSGPCAAGPGGFSVF